MAKLQKGLNKGIYERDETSINNIVGSSTFNDYVLQNIYDDSPSLFRKNKYDIVFGENYETYSKEEIRNMPPEDLNKLMQENSLYTAAQSDLGTSSLRIGRINLYSKENQDAKANELKNMPISNNSFGRINLIMTGFDGAPDSRLRGLSPLEQYKLIKNDPGYARKAIIDQRKTNFENEQDDWATNLVRGLVVGSATAGLTGGLGGAVGLASPTLGSIISSGAATGAASGAAVSAAAGGDLLTGALKGAAVGFVLKDLGVANKVMDKFKETFGIDPPDGMTPGEAAEAIALDKGKPVDLVVENQAQKVYGEGFSLDAVDVLGQPDPGFQYNWENGKLVSNVDGGLPEAILGPNASLGIGNALTGTVPGSPPEYTIEPNTGEVTPTQDVMNSIIPSDPQDLFNGTMGSGNTESPESGGGSGGGGFDLSDLLDYGTPLLGAGLSLYDYFKRQGEAEELEEANRRAAERADPWGEYRPGYAQRLNEFMQTSPNLPDAPNRQSPLDFAQDNPYVSTSGLNEFLQNTPTPIERMEANPFESQSGLFELLKDPNSIKESPAYQFRLNQGLNALDRRLASAGHRFSGNRMTAITDYAQAAASQEFENEFGRRAQYYDREFDLYRTDADRYLQNYIGEANTRAATENINRSQYDTDMDRYGDEFGREYDRYVTDYELAYNTYQKNLENLMTLAGVNPNAQSEGAGYGLQGVTVGNLQDQANRGNLADAGASFLEFLSKL